MTEEREIKEFYLRIWNGWTNNEISVHTTLKEAKAAAQEHFENEVKKHLVEV